MPCRENQQPIRKYVPQFYSLNEGLSNYLRRVLTFELLKDKDNKSELILNCLVHRIHLKEDGISANQKTGCIPNGYPVWGKSSLPWWVSFRTGLPNHTYDAIFKIIIISQLGPVYI